MDKITKFLRKRTKKERMLLMSVMSLVLENKLNALDIKSLVGSKNFFRIRVGSFRIIFEKFDKENIIRFVGKRDENTYKNRE